MEPALTSIPGLRTFDVPDTRGHDVVYALAAGGGLVHLGMSNEFTPGVCAYVSVFDAATGTFRKVIDIAEATGYKPDSGMMPHSKIHLSLNATPEGRVFAATHFTAPAIGQTSFNLLAACRGLFEGSHLVEYNLAGGRVTSYGCVLPGEGCRISVLDPVREFVYLVSYPRNHLVRFHYPTRTLDDLGRMGQENPFGIEVAPDGCVYTTDDHGRVPRCDAASGGIEELDLFLLLKPGRRCQGNYARRTTLGLDGSTYGTGNKGARLFRLLPGGRRIVDYGPALGEEARTDHAFPHLPPVKALVQTDPDTLYLAVGGDGVYADQFQIPSLVRYRIAARQAGGRPLHRRRGRTGVDPAVRPLRARAALRLLRHAARRRPAQAVERVAARVRARRARTRVVHVRVDRRPAGESDAGSVRHERAGLRPDAVRRASTRVDDRTRGRGEGLVIPPGECAVSDLFFAGETLYGITAGRRPHLFRHSPGYQNRFLENCESHVCDLGAIDEAPAGQARIFEWPGSSRLLLLLESEDGVRAAVYDRAAEARHCPPHYHSIPHWPQYFAGGRPFEMAGTFATGEFSAGSAVLDPAAERIWSIDEEGRLRACNLRGRACGALDKSRWAPYSLCMAGSGRLFAVSQEGRPALIGLRRLEAEFFAEGAPLEWSCRAAAGPERIALGARDGTVAIWDVPRRRWLDPVRLPGPGRVNALAFAPGGALYGFNGEPDGIGEAFVVRFPEAEPQRIGVLQVSSHPRYWMCHRCAAVCAGGDGEVFFGESDRISHLFSYRP